MLPFKRGLKIVRENRDKDWSKEDCRDVAVLFYQNKKRNKDLSLHPFLPNRGAMDLALPGQEFRKEAYYIDPVSRERITVTQLKQLYNTKCAGPAPAVEKDKTKPSPKPSGPGPLSTLDDKVLKELDQQKEEKALHEKAEEEAKAEKKAENKEAAIAAGLLVLAGLAIVGYVIYRKY